VPEASGSQWLGNASSGAARRGARGAGGGGAPGVGRALIVLFAGDFVLSLCCLRNGNGRVGDPERVSLLRMDAGFDKSHNPSPIEPLDASWGLIRALGLFYAIYLLAADVCHSYRPSFQCILGSCLLVVEYAAENSHEDGQAQALLASYSDAYAIRMTRVCSYGATRIDACLAPLVTLIFLHVRSLPQQQDKTAQCAFDDPRALVLGSTYPICIFLERHIQRPLPLLYVASHQCSSNSPVTHPMRPLR
jgi:hypothetical protein